MTECRRARGGRGRARRFTRAGGTSLRSRWAIGLAFGALAIGAGCREEPRARAATGQVSGNVDPAVRTAGFAAGPPTPAPAIRNPLAGDESALAEGRRLFVWYNCAGCHGMEGGGGMGPPLADDDWIYGSAPNNVFQSIVQGRPNGMPAFSMLSQDHVWKLVLRVRELGDLPDRPHDQAGEGAAGQSERGGG